MYEIIAEGHFDAAHFLADYHGKCENLHGHRWRVEATFRAEQLQVAGDEASMVMDFSAAKAAVREAADAFDHALIYEAGTLRAATVEALEGEGFHLVEVPWRTTAENFAHAIFEVLRGWGLPVVAVEVDETPHNRAIFRVPYENF